MQQTDAQLRALEKLASGELRRALDGSAVWRTPGLLATGVSSGTVSLLVRRGLARIVTDRTIKRCLITDAGRALLARFTTHGDEEWQRSSKPAAF